MLLHDRYIVPICIVGEHHHGVTFALGSARVFSIVDIFLFPNWRHLYSITKLHYTVIRR